VINAAHCASSLPHHETDCPTECAAVDDVVSAQEEGSFDAAIANALVKRDNLTVLVKVFHFLGRNYGQDVCGAALLLCVNFMGAMFAGDVSCTARPKLLAASVPKRHTNRAHL
jgi:hypothetical protein